MLNAAEKRTIARILKVNHAGEYGAIRIYLAQIWVSRLLYPDILGFLEETLSHERTHLEAFSELMPSRDARPCRIMSLWGNGGFLLGFLTALMGRRGVWVCTAAVEATVHRHLEDQLNFLRDRDPTLCTLVLEIQEQEQAHLDYAVNRIHTESLIGSSVDRAISLTTDCLIWLSTWGDSARMAREMEHRKS